MADSYFVGCFYAADFFSFGTDFIRVLARRAYLVRGREHSVFFPGLGGLDIAGQFGLFDFLFYIDALVSVFVRSERVAKKNRDFVCPADVVWIQFAFYSHLAGDFIKLSF